MTLCYTETHSGASPRHFGARGHFRAKPPGDISGTLRSVRLLALAIVTLTACSGSVGDAQGETDAVTPPPDTAIDAGADVVVALDSASDSAETAVSDAWAPDRSKCTADPDKKGLVTRTASGKSYLVYVPAGYDPMSPSALLLALHGAGDVASNYLAAIWRGNADARGFVVVAPDGSCAVGSGNTWCSGDGAAIEAALNDVEACYSVDPKRRIIDGFSAGGILSYAIGLDNAASFAGISVASANLGSAEALVGAPLLPAAWKIPVSHHHGLTDTNFPIDTARAGRDRLVAAGHTVYWHEFDGGHTTNAAMALVRWDDLASSRAP